MYIHSTHHRLVLPSHHGKLDLAQLSRSRIRGFIKLDYIPNASL